MISSITGLSGRRSGQLDHRIPAAEVIVVRVRNRNPFQDRVLAFLLSLFYHDHPFAFIDTIMLAIFSAAALLPLAFAQYGGYGGDSSSAMTTMMTMTTSAAGPASTSTMSMNTTTHQVTVGALHLISSSNPLSLSIPFLPSSLFLPIRSRSCPLVAMLISAPRFHG